MHIFGPKTLKSKIVSQKYFVIVSFVQKIKMLHLSQSSLSISFHMMTHFLQT